VDEITFATNSIFSIVLLAIVDPFYKFIMMDIGSYWHHSNSGIFEDSLFYNEYIKGKTLLSLKPLPGMTELIPHVLIRQ